MARQQTVRLMSDYWADWPLWVSDGNTSASDLGISAGLAARLQAWQDHFEESFRHDSGWQSPDDADAYAREGRQLRWLLNAEIGDTYLIELDLWPVAEPDTGRP